MTTRPTAVKPTYRPIKNDEVKPIANIYKAMISEAGILALFTNEDASINAGWLTSFDGSITAVGNIKSSRTIIKENKDITKAIKTESKNCVRYGKTLTYWLNKTFSDQPGLIESFPITAANAKMEAGETEGLLDLINTIIQQFTTNQAAMVTAGWAAASATATLANYQTLYTNVEAINTAQELAKKAVPDNTDAATNVRNKCYAYIQTMVTLKDIIWYDDLTKRHQWAISTNLNQVRA